MPADEVPMIAWASCVSGREQTPQQLSLALAETQALLAASYRLSDAVTTVEAAEGYWPLPGRDFAAAEDESDRGVRLTRCAVHHPGRHHHLDARWP